MFNIEKFKEELSKYGLTLEIYDKIITDIDSKIDGENDYDWSEIKDKYGINCNSDTIRKSSSTPFGGKMRSEYEKYKIGSNKNVSDDSELDVKIQELRRERIKLQTSNVERNRLDRSEARQELYYEYVGNIIQTLPLPDFQPIEDNIHHEINYLVGLADIHYGATYKSINNEYSPKEAKRRFEYLTCRLIAYMLNELSAYVNISYYHTPSANHTQIRVLNAKASELADEDLEYLMGNYIKDLCANNERINVHLANEGDDFIEVYVPGNEIIAMHGHQIKNVENAVRDISILHKKFYDTILLGHYHSGKEIPSHEGILGDAEVLISPSFIGSDPYSDKLCKGSKACVKVYGFDKLFGHTETYKIILN